MKTRAKNKRYKIWCLLLCFSLGMFSFPDSVNLAYGEEFSDGEWKTMPYENTNVEQSPAEIFSGGPDTENNELKKTEGEQETFLQGEKLPDEEPEKQPEVNEVKVTGEDEPTEAPVSGNPDTEGSDDVISCEIIWTSMDFTYSYDNWDPENLVYRSAGWKTDGGKITVINNGELPIEAGYTYASASEEMEGFTVTVEGLSSGQQIQKGENLEANVVLNGRPEQTMENETIGTITITIS